MPAYHEQSSSGEEANRGSFSWLPSCEIGI